MKISLLDLPFLKNFNSKLKVFLLRLLSSLNHVQNCTSPIQVSSEFEHLLIRSLIILAILE